MGSLLCGDESSGVKLRMYPGTRKYNIKAFRFGVASIQKHFQKFGIWIGQLLFCGFFFSHKA